MEIRRKLKTANRFIKERNWSAVTGKIKLRRRARSEAKNYAKWILKHQITENERQKISLEIATFSHAPLISVILPVYNVEEKWLRLCIESVLKQIYERWELCIADDNSPSPQVRRVLEEYAAQDKRIKIVFRPVNGHISAASNSALELATGEFCAFLDHDDELSEDALFYIAKEINEFPETAVFYSDEDMIDERGKRYQPKFKPDFSRDLFYSLNLFTHLSTYKTEILRKIGGFRIGLEGSQDYDLALRFTEQTDENQIRHIPRILYHWRAIRGSVALSGEEKPYAHERARQAIQEHLERIGKKATVSKTVLNYHRIQYELPENLPKVSLILFAGDNFKALDQALETFTNKTAYQNFEILLLCSENEKSRLESDNPAKLIIKTPGNKAENFNRAVLQSDGEILCFVDANLRPLEKDWLKELTSFAVQTEIGAVGGKVFYKNETILHGGLIFGFNDLIGVAHQNLPKDAGGNLHRARVINNFSAVSAQCLAVRRELFDVHCGFDAINLPDSLFDADFCLRLREKNLRVVFTPYAELIQTEKSDSQIKPAAQEIEFFRQKWRHIIENDPFYNPNLSLADETFTILE